jgi:protein involved in polysaccharide export with SLBB domain
MGVRRSEFRGLAILALSAISFLPCTPTSGQSSSDSSPIDTGLQMLQGLSPDQRDAIMNQLGIGGGGGAGGGGVGGGSQSQGGRERQNDQQLGDMDADRAEQLKRQEEEFDLRSPYLKGDDWVIVAIDIVPLPPLTQSPFQQQQQQQQQQQANGQSGISGLPASALSALQASSPAAAAALGGAAAQPSNGVGPNTNANGSTGNGNTGNGTGTGNGNGTGTGNGNGNAGAYPDLQQVPKPDLTDEELKERDKLLDLIRSKNPYQLSHEGELFLPGFAPIPLGGLTEDLAALRIQAEPAVHDFYIRVTKLPLRKLGTAALKPFGYDLFDRRVSSFAPVTNIPVPSNYVMGPGDQLNVQLYGNQNRQLMLTVGRDGRIQFPILGPITVTGETFETVRSTLEARVERQMIGTHASISMGDTRAIRVFVLGDAKRPGSYTISGLGTISSALFAAGGVRPVGSLRNIQLKREGAIVRRLDLYDMLIRGDTTDDAKLLPGDVIFIPPIGSTIGVDGEVRRPAIYETKGETTIAEVVQLAGGLTPEADLSNAALTRIDAAQHRVVLRVDLAASGVKGQPVRNGDNLRVSRLRPKIDAGVLVQGYAYSTGTYAYHPGMRITDILHSADDLKPNADLHYLLIRRELPPDDRIVVLSADLGEALRAPGSAADVPLMARDQITAFDLQSSRDRVIHPLMEELKLQSHTGNPEAVVRIEGRAKVPGDYPFEQGMTVRDLVRAGGSLSDAAYVGNAELTRYKVAGGDNRRAQLIEIDLAAVMRGDAAANIRLEPFDNLSIKEVQAWGDKDEVILRGEVKFPGNYAIKRGETLSSVIRRAGGLTDFAFPEGAVFTRKELKDREQKQLDMLAIHMQNDIAFLALQGAAANQAQAGTALSVGQSLLTQLKATRAVGRLVIDLQQTLQVRNGYSMDVILRDGDQLIVPKLQQEVTVIGEVQSATSHLYRPDLSRDDYIAMSGGKTRRADGGRIYVVRANGSVVVNNGGRWYRSGAVQIKPGDTIVVPLDAEHLPLLPLWQAVTQILYNVAIAAAAVHSF